MRKMQEKKDNIIVPAAQNSGLMQACRHAVAAGGGAAGGPGRDIFVDFFRNLNIGIIIFAEIRRFYSPMSAWPQFAI